MSQPIMRDGLLLAAAGRAGRVLRHASRVLAATVPDAFGALAIAYGLWEAWHPLGPVALGGFVLLASWRSR